MPMGFGSDVSWDRYALIAEIVQRFHTGNHRLGKTVLQKLVFLLQHSFGVDCDYGYTLYTYGPYSTDLARDLDIVAGLGGARLDCDSGFAGYDIHPGPAAKDLLERASSFLQEIAPKLDQLLRDFGQFGAQELELRTTAVYLAKPGLDRDKLVERVHDVKPHFSPAQISAAIRELEQKAYIGAPAVMHGS